MLRARRPPAPAGLFVNMLRSIRSCAAPRPRHPCACPLPRGPVPAAGPPRPAPRPPFLRPCRRVRTAPRLLRSAAHVLRNPCIRHSGRSAAWGAGRRIRLAGTGASSGLAGACGRLPLLEAAAAVRQRMSVAGLRQDESHRVVPAARTASLSGRAVNAQGRAGAQFALKDLAPIVM